MTSATICWRRLDQEGHDSCRLHSHAGGWSLEGIAIFLQEARPACLRYAVECDEQWQTHKASVSGWLGDETLSLRIIRTASGEWLLNGVAQDIREGLIDLDLGFTPATNTIALRRLRLGIGHEEAAPAAYLAFPELRLDLLEQRYKRIDGRRYAYEALRFSYDATLEVSEEGFVRYYPGLWEAVGSR